MRNLVTSLVLAAVFLLAPPAQARDALRERIDAFVRAEQKRLGVPGLAVGVVSHGRVVLAKGYGFANLEHGVPVGTDTLFQSGSVGKMFTATALMLQVEAGRVSLSDSVTKYFPDAPATWKPITVRHLLTHTSGIKDLEGLLDERKDYTEQQFAEFIYKLPLEFPAGLRWNYSNSGYVLLGILVNRVAGMTYQEVLARQVFKPAGMKTARGISEADVIPNRAAGYQLVGGAVKNQGWVSQSLNTTGDGALYFSLKDMLAWEEAVEKRALLTQDSWREVLSPVKLNSGAAWPYGFGWEVLDRNGKPLHQHTGAWQGFRTAYARFLGDGLSIVVLANLDRANPTLFVEGIAAIVNPALAVPPLKPIPDTEPEVTAKLAALLEKTRQGAWEPSMFAYVPDRFMAEAGPYFQATLQKLGPAGPLVLAKRETRGDDRLYTYLVQFGAATWRYRVGLSTDDRVTLFTLQVN
ncbi:serine hydrolase domain-containing protein [Corallococcus aberystwythensis]|uniref:Class A beta-lactamase-related serine hydrolase n=1 Tax=Corallococcus aberystwythensis TaxID=2316722 RepID=A0A3A8Q2Y9_9BACT|nr:serine hydrolase domain-containing protein [Corallococcus aberystwythensis]RKH63117.1 class A beta-lactamase-related serine hydrolase [Corallococcus aberystwythensis]